MPTEVFPIRIEKDDVKYLEEYAKRVGMLKTPFVQGLLQNEIRRLKKEPMPPPVEPDLPPEKLPQNTSWWRRYKRAMGDK